MLQGIGSEIQPLPRPTSSNVEQWQYTRSIIITFMCLCCRVWGVKYNHFHDQLVLTSSSDSRVVLNNIVSLSSEPFGRLLENEDDSDNDSLQDRSVFLSLSLSLSLPQSFSLFLTLSETLSVSLSLPQSFAYWLF